MFTPVGLDIVGGEPAYGFEEPEGPYEFLPETQIVKVVSGRVVVFIQSADKVVLV